MSQHSHDDICYGNYFYIANPCTMIKSELKKCKNDQIFYDKFTDLAYTHLQSTVWEPKMQCKSIKKICKIIGKSNFLWKLVTSLCLVLVEKIFQSHNSQRSPKIGAPLLSGDALRSKAQVRTRVLAFQDHSWP